LEELEKFPKSDIKLKTEKGIAICQKTDIFKGLMWYAYEGEWMNWHKLTAAQANEIIKLNNENKTVASLEEYAISLTDEHTKNEFENVVGQDSLTRFDKPKRKKKRNYRKNKKRNKNAK